MKGSYNYKTYYLGSPKELENSSSLVLLMADDFGGISLEKLKTLQDLVQENPEGKPIKTTLWKDSNIFRLEFGESEIFSFDTIIYVNPVSGYTGYTIFSSPQNCFSSSGIPFRKLNISLVFNRYQGEGTENILELHTYLDPNTENTKILGTAERWEYPETRDVSSGEEGYLKFTNRPSDFLGDPGLCMITESGIVTHSGGISGLPILSGVEVDSDSFSLIRPVLYGDDLAVLKYSYQTGEYCVSSLSTLNPFGRPYDYLSGIMQEKPQGNLIGYTGRYLVFLEENNYSIFLMETGDTIKRPIRKEGSLSCVVFDRWDPTEAISYSPEDVIKKKVSESCVSPDRIVDSYLEKVGGWWIFGGLEERSPKLYVSRYGIIKGDLKIDFISDRLGMYSDRGICHFFTIDLGHTYEIKEERVLDTTTKEYVDIQVKHSTPISSLPGDLRMFLGGLRKKPLTLPGCLPRPEKIIGVGLGMIFYLSEEGLLYCY